MQLRPFVFALASTLLATTASCETRVSLGTPCRSAAECNDGLVCSFGRCRAACERQTDCAGAQLCIQGAGQRAVCTLVDDTCAGANQCSAGLVCNMSTSVCAVPCTPMSCVSGSSCTDVNAMAICVRDDLVNACELGVPAASSGMTTNALFGAGFAATGVAEVTLLRGTVPTIIPDSEPLALALDGRRAWIASAQDNGIGTTNRSRDRLLWEVTDIFGASTVATDIARPDFDAINDVHAADARLGPDGLSAVFVRNNPDTDHPQPFYRLFDSPLRERSIVDTSEARFPGGCAHFGGIAPEGNDDSVIALAVKDRDSEERAASVFVIPGNTPSAGAVNVPFASPWPTPLPLFGTEGALVARNTETERVELLRLNRSTRELPSQWTWGDNMQARAIDITHVPGDGMEDHFVLASLHSFAGEGCNHVRLTHLVCSVSECTVQARIQVPTDSWTRDIHITSVPNGFALVTMTDFGHVTWLDRSLQVVGRRAELFPRVLSMAPTFGLQHIAIASSDEGLMALAIYRNAATDRYSEARYVRSGFVFGP